MNKVCLVQQGMGQCSHAACNFFMKDGHAIHGSYEVKHLGKAVSHGCVRISPQNATTLYALAEKTALKNTQVVLAGDHSRRRG
jgi:lipoprotein-anchoring transpeptidase ErfK/SrfK